MLDRVGEQFHQFIAPTRSLPLPPSLPPLFDAYNNPSHLHQHHLPLHLQQPNLLSPLHHKDEGEEEQQRGRIMSFEISEGEGGLGEHDELIGSTTWTDDEVLALLRIRSDLDAWFPHLTWEHVSRKLAEVGFKRSAEKCKEKFEEETSYLNSIHYTTKNSGYRFMSELEQLYQQQQQQLQLQLQEEEEEEEHEMPAGVGQLEVECEERKQAPENPAHQQEEEEVKMDEALQKKRRTRGKRKREEDKLEIVRGCCEKMVKKMMEKQEEMQKKLLEEMVRRDGEIMARQEAWKKEEMEGMNWELQLMAKEQAVAAQRQAAIIQLLNKISEQHQHQQQQGQYHYYYCCSGSVSSDDDRNNNNNNNNPNCAAAAAASLSSNSSSQNPNPSTIIISNNKGENNNPDDQPAPVVVNCASEGDKQEADCGGEGKTREKEEVGRRWPREEVMALIKVRSSSSSNNEGGGGGSRMNNNNIPLWERISEGMRGMGYNRSAKRCKEKWENINKYFRKTQHLSKNVNRSLHSRTCPYFPQLTSFYSQHHH